MAHLEDEEDTTSVYKLPESKFPVNRSSSDPISSGLGVFKLEEPPQVAVYDPSRLVMVMDIP